MAEVEKLGVRERAYRSLDSVKIAALMWDSKGANRRKEIRRIEEDLKEVAK